MQIPPMRPSFAIEFPIESSDAVDRLSSLVRDADYPIEGRVAGNHLMLVIPPSRRHFWSPWLHLEVHDRDDGSRVKGRFSPNPSVWTGFMLTYIALATLIFFAAMFGVSQWLMNKPPSALMLMGIPLMIGIIMYWSSLIGQRIAHEQMQELYDASMQALGNEQTAPPL
jgi:hypothetical protein